MECLTLAEYIKIYDRANLVTCLEGVGFLRDLDNDSMAKLSLFLAAKWNSENGGAKVVDMDANGRV